MNYCKDCDLFLRDHPDSRALYEKFKCKCPTVQITLEAWA